MRRPMKPFVTEYKPSSRRQLSAPRHPQSFANEPASPKPSETGWFEASSRTDDSYEAALRAADALFSPQKDKPDHAGDDATAAGGVRDTAGRGSGRILRVLDEPPPERTSDLMSELEREHAPKRRGRKPGSKNRPKADRAVPPSAAPASDIQAFDARTRHIPSPFEVADRDERADDPAADTGDDVGATQGEAVARDQHDSDHRDVGQDDPEVIARETTKPVAGLRSRERRRFSWVRTTLKPGQEWKRRLPKVCW